MRDFGVKDYEKQWIEGNILGVKHEMHIIEWKEIVDATLLLPSLESPF